VLVRIREKLEPLDTVDGNIKQIATTEEQIVPQKTKNRTM
jgi:hypothetical protein